MRNVGGWVDGKKKHCCNLHLSLLLFRNSVVSCKKSCVLEKFSVKIRLDLKQYRGYEKTVAVSPNIGLDEPIPFFSFSLN